MSKSYAMEQRQSFNKEGYSNCISTYEKDMNLDTDLTLIRKTTTNGL